MIPVDMRLHCFANCEIGQKMPISGLSASSKSVKVGRIFQLCMNILHKNVVVLLFFPSECLHFEKPYFMSASQWGVTNKQNESEKY